MAIKTLTAVERDGKRNGEAIRRLSLFVRESRMKGGLPPENDENRHNEDEEQTT